jgi:NADP-dependent 3-hydroxy acid dehydrogenase YdfG
MANAPSFRDRRALVTGASRGIGRAIAAALLARGTRVALVARDEAALKDLAGAHRRALALAADIAAPGAAEHLGARIAAHWGGLDILVNCAGVFAGGAMREAAVENLDRAYATNVRAPYALTKALLPLIAARKGQIVFINSTVTRAANLAGRGQYAAMALAQRAIADSLRDEINKDGVRVMTIYPGSTATRLQRAIHRDQGKTYRPSRLLQPGDVAQAVCDALAMPRTAEVTDLYVRPMLKS